MERIECKCETGGDSSSCPWIGDPFSRKHNSLPVFRRRLATKDPEKGDSVSQSTSFQCKSKSLPTTQTSSQSGVNLSSPAHTESTEEMKDGVLVSLVVVLRDDIIRPFLPAVVL